jgi:uncharacterized membrane protein YjgN (DUF898 family)
VAYITIRCPHCGYSKKTDQSKIPPGATRGRCPECGEAFSLKPTSQSSGAPPAGRAAVGTILPPEAPRQVGFEFHGTGADYFGIWIVNSLLKIVTLGVYSPWAKVRRRSYFYGCTTLEGKNFDYLANPMALLKGWLIGALLFLLYLLGSNFSPLLSLFIGLLLFILAPWVIVRSRMFNNRNSAHRNIRFSFSPDYGGAYTVYLGLSLLIPLTLGILTPYVIYRQKKFHVENSNFGTTPFTFTACSGDYYRLFLRGIGFTLLLAVCSGILGAFLEPESYGFGGLIAIVVVPLLFVAGYMSIALYFYVALTNLTWSSVRLARHSFVCHLSVRRMFWIFLSNGVAIIFSAGLLTPWATVRLARYRIEQLSLVVDGSLEEFESLSQPDISAVGEEIGDIFDVDFGL